MSKTSIHVNGREYSIGDIVAVMVPVFTTDIMDTELRLWKLGIIAQLDSKKITVILRHTALPMLPRSYWNINFVYKDIGAKASNSIKNPNIPYTINTSFLRIIKGGRFQDKMENIKTILTCGGIFSDKPELREITNYMIKNIK
jgi:hypothetical protein